MDLQSYKAAVVLAIYEYQMVCVIPCQIPFAIRSVVPGSAAPHTQILADQLTLF